VIVPAPWAVPGRLGGHELSAAARARLDQVNEEFLRRAGIAWQRVS
jgi:hypothetical protein